MSLQERRTRVNNEPERTTNLQGRRTYKDDEPARATNLQGRRTYKDDNPTRARPPRNGTLLSDARRVRFGEKITSEAVKGRLLLILILIISARAQNVKESGFEFCKFPFRRCKRPCGADAVVTGGVLLSVIYSYAARVRRNELHSNHRRKRDALTVKSAAVLCCAPKRIPAFFFTQTSNHF